MTVLALDLGASRISRSAARRTRVEIVPAQPGDDVGLVGGLALARLARIGDDGYLHNDAR